MKLHTENKKLVNENGEIFFYTADTAWELFHKLTFEEAKVELMISGKTVVSPKKMRRTEATAKAVRKKASQI